MALFLRKLAGSGSIAIGCSYGLVLDRVAPAEQLNLLNPERNPSGGTTRG